MFPSLPKTPCFWLVDDFSQCDHGPACDPAGAFPSLPKTPCFWLVNDFSQCEHGPACGPAGAVYCHAQDTVFLISYAVSQRERKPDCERKPASGPAGAVYRLAQDRPA